MVAALMSIACNQEPQLQTVPKGERVVFPDAQLFIPEGFQPDREGLDITLQLHGSAGVAERNFMQSAQPGVLVSVMLNGLSGVYTEKFKDPQTFQRLIDETLTQLKARGYDPGARIRSVTVVSFSAGFGGVRELLKDSKIFARIDAIVMLDSIHAGFTGNPEERKVDPVNMEGFLKFAREALQSKKTMLITHSEIRPDNYASTMETADYLIAQLGKKREQVHKEWVEGLVLQSRFEEGRLTIYGFKGDTGADHMKHLHNTFLFTRRLKT
jgi:hypothetical protein